MRTGPRGVKLVNLLDRDSAEIGYRVKTKINHRH